MIRNNRLPILILWIAVALLCIVVCRAATDDTYNFDEKRATLTVERVSDGGWHAVLCGLPAEARRVALMVELELSEEALIPRMALCGEAASTLTLTVGLPTEGRLRLLIDGFLPEGHGGIVCLLCVEGSDGQDAPRLRAVEQGLWLMDAEGRAVAYPLSVESTETVETPTESASESVPALKTEAETEIETETETETEAEVPPLPDFVGCGEVIVGERGFSVELSFWGGEDCRAPATVCMGGGQEVTLTARRIGGTSAVVYTYRGLRAEGECRIYVFTEEGVFTLRLRDGAVVE